MAHTVVGMAGHIDHGKTLLVKALTGTDTDRAPEEKARGITIELGFAFLGDDIALVDVPGHERFVKTDRKSTRLNSSHSQQSRMPSSA